MICFKDGKRNEKYKFYIYLDGSHTHAPQPRGFLEDRTEADSQHESKFRVKIRRHSEAIIALIGGRVVVGVPVVGAHGKHVCRNSQLC